MRATTFPLPLMSDPEDVALALETAQAFWKNLKYAEAVRWLRRAALAAEESGDDLRVVRLAAAAADISAELLAGGEPSHASEAPAPHGPRAEATSSQYGNPPPVSQRATVPSSPPNPLDASHADPATEDDAVSFQPPRFQRPSPPPLPTRPEPPPLPTRPEPPPLLTRPERPPVPTHERSSATPSASAESPLNLRPPPAEIEPEPVLERGPAILREVDPHDVEETTAVGFGGPALASPPTGVSPASPVAPTGISPASPVAPTVSPASPVTPPIVPPIAETPATSSVDPPSPDGSSKPPSFFPSSQVGTSSPGTGRVDGLRAHRVSVQRSSDGTLTVRPLRDSEQVPAGAREAILVFSGSTRAANSE
jgi:hypothetical protein